MQSPRRVLVMPAHNCYEYSLQYQNTYFFRDHLQRLKKYGGGAMQRDNHVMEDAIGDGDNDTVDGRGVLQT